MVWVISKVGPLWLRDGKMGPRRDIDRVPVELHNITEDELARSYRDLYVIPEGKLQEYQERALHVERMAEQAVEEHNRKWFRTVLRKAYTRGQIQIDVTVRTFKAFMKKIGHGTMLPDHEVCQAEIDEWRAGVLNTSVENKTSGKTVFGELDADFAGELGEDFDEEDLEDTGDE